MSGQNFPVFFLRTESLYQDSSRFVSASLRCHFRHKSYWCVCRVDMRSRLQIPPESASLLEHSGLSSTSNRPAFKASSINLSGGEGGWEGGREGSPLFPMWWLIWTCWSKAEVTGGQPGQRGEATSSCDCGEAISSRYMIARCLSMSAHLHHCRF